jgi:hypothetical protein
VPCYTLTCPLQRTLLDGIEIADHEQCYKTEHAY